MNTITQVLLTLPDDVARAADAFGTLLAVFTVMLAVVCWSYKRTRQWVYSHLRRPKLVMALVALLYVRALATLALRLILLAAIIVMGSTR
jgi:type IV secretory pathway TrbL component